MKIFAIGDLHLSLAQSKEMDIFGEHWKNHFDKIKADWLDKVTNEDVVIIAGDISWAMKFEDAFVDIEAICALPGKKIMIKGNHDYWWPSLIKLKQVLTNDTHVLQNNCLEVGKYVFCGSRGWSVDADSESDIKILEREKLRLELSLSSGQNTDKELFAIMHFPPFYKEETDFTKLFEKYNVKNVVFGHLHGECLKNINFRDFKFNEINYNLVSADYLDFKLKRIV